MGKLQEGRKSTIAQIVNTFREAHVKGVELNDKALIDEVCIEKGCSIRTAREYIRIAKAIWQKQNTIS